MADPNSSISPTKPATLIDATSRDAYALWARRTGRPLYHFTQDRAGWEIACPHCGGPRLLEIVTDSEMGTFFKPEPCPCGGQP